MHAKIELNMNFIKSFHVYAAVFFFYANIPIYLVLVGYSSTPPSFWIGLFAAVILLSLTSKLFARDQVSEITCSKPLLYWAFFFIMINLVSFFFSDPSEIVIKTLERRILSAFVILLFFTALEDDGGLQRKVRWVLLLAVLIAIADNIYDFMNPSLFVPLDNEFANPGRAAGFYLNANQAGAALVLGMILTIELLPKKIRTLYLYIVLIGILLTFSRTALIGWILVTLILLFQNVLNKKQFIAGIAIATFIILLILNQLTEIDLIDKLSEGINLPNITERIDWISNPLTTEDASLDERRVVFKRAWEMFLNHPLIGNGIGSTLTWNEEISTHNTYLYFMADYGVIGLFILPLLLLASIWRASGEARQTALPFLAFVTLFGFFSHNIVEEYYFLISFAIMASMSARSRISNKGV